MHACTCTCVYKYTTADQHSEIPSYYPDKKYSHGFFFQTVDHSHSVIIPKPTKKPNKIKTREHII